MADVRVKSCKATKDSLQLAPARAVAEQWQNCPADGSVQKTTTEGIRMSYVSQGDHVQYGTTQAPQEPVRRCLCKP